MDKINIPLAVAHKETLPGDKFAIYAWLLYMCSRNTKNEWEVDYRTLCKLSGYPLKRISATIRHLELTGIMDVNRSNRVTIRPNVVPDRYVEMMASLFVNVDYMKRLKEIAKPIPVDQILQS